MYALRKSRGNGAIVRTPIQLFDSSTVIVSVCDVMNFLFISLKRKVCHVTSSSSQFYQIVAQGGFNKQKDSIYRKTCDYCCSAFATKTHPVSCALCLH